MDRQEMIELRNEAFRKIQNDPTLWKQWNDAEDSVDMEYDRELLMTYALRWIVYERGYRDGRKDAEDQSWADAAGVDI